MWDCGDFPRSGGAERVGCGGQRDGGDETSNHLPDVGGGAEGHSGLRANPAPESQILAKLALDGCLVQHLGLEGVEHVNAYLDKVGYDLVHFAVRMEGNEQAGVNGFGGADHGSQARLEPFSPVIGSYDECSLGPKVICEQ